MKVIFKIIANVTKDLLTGEESGEVETHMEGKEPLLINLLVSAMKVSKEIAMVVLKAVAIFIHLSDSENDENEPFG